VLQARVDASFKSRPDCTAPQVIELLKPEHPIYIILAERFLRTTRTAAAKRNPAHPGTTPRWAAEQWRKNRRAL